jgi:cytochrome c553
MTRVVLVMLLALACACSVFAADDGGAALREQGRALFHGERTFERPVSVADVALPADAAPCARCHGVSGEGAREGGVAVPALQGARAAADTARWLGAAAQGHGRDGRALQAAMPRYDWSASEREALAAFVTALGTDAEPVRGVTPRTLTLGTLLPLSGPRAALGQAVLQGLRSHFDDINRAGGLYGRSIELLPIDWQGGDADLRAAVQGQGVLALVGSFVGDLTPAQSQELQALRLPMIGNLGPAMRQSQTSAAADWASALWPSVGAQLQASAAEFEARCPANGAALHVLQAPLPGLAPAIEAALPGRALHVTDALPARGAAPRRVLALHNGARVQALRASLDARDCLWTLAMFSGAATTGRATELVTLPGQAALPMVAMADGRGGELWPSLGRLSAQLATEALSRAGRGVQPEHLVRALAALPAFEPAPGVRLELSRQRRHALPVLTTWNTP